MNFFHKFRKIFNLLFRKQTVPTEDCKGEVQKGVTLTKICDLTKQFHLLLQKFEMLYYEIIFFYYILPQIFKTCKTKIQDHNILRKF